jgi:tetratricopeptide (TPR) repeat protein
MNINKTVELDGKEFIWNGERWFDKSTFIIPPHDIINTLNLRLMPDLEKEDSTVNSIKELLERSVKAKSAGQYTRSEKLTRRVLSIDPENLGALAILSSCLRLTGKPESALQETEGFKTANYTPLITSRAAALCDLGRWEEAKKTIGRSLAIRKNNLEAFTVVNRIKSERPDLYKKRD